MGKRKNSKKKAPPPGFADAARAYFFFTRRYMLVFYSVLGFALLFALLFSLGAFLLAVLGVTEGEGFRGDVDFLAKAVAFFGLGLQGLMALATIAYNLWHITFQKGEPHEELPETLKHMHALRRYHGATGNIFSKFLAFLLPGLLTTLALVVPLFTLLAYIGQPVQQTIGVPDFLRGVIVPDAFLVWLSVLLTNLNYYLGIQHLDKISPK